MSGYNVSYNKVTVVTNALHNIASFYMYVSYSRPVSAFSVV